MLIFFAINSYPKISYKKEATTLNDSIVAWETCNDYHTIKELKRRYPFKKIIISETGCNDYWLALTNPGDWTLTEGSNKTNGVAPNLMLEGLFNSEISNVVNEVWWCYYDTILNTICKNTLTRYQGGVCYE